MPLQLIEKALRIPACTPFSTQAYFMWAKWCLLNSQIPLINTDPVGVAVKSHTVV